MEDGQVKSLISDRNVTSVDEEESQLVEKQGIGSGRSMPAYYAIPPARRLPPELVAEIFFKSQPPVIEMQSNSSLCSICSAWRAVALSTHRLWTTVRMTVSDQIFSNQMALLRLWCERAGSLPLQIHLSSKPSFSGNPILVLTPNLPNVQTMELRLPRHCIKSLQSFSEGTFRLLESMSIHVSDDEEGDGGDTADIDVFESAQRLTKVSLSGYALGCKVLLPPQISHLIDYTPRSVDAYYYVLQHCPNLEHLQLHLDFWDNRDNKIMQTFLLLQLHTLDLLVFQEFALDSLVAPALQFISTHVYGTWPHPSFLSLISRSSCTPVRLEIFEADLDDQLFLECLRSLPSIVELKLHDVSSAGTWLTDALVYNASDPDPLVPRLEVLGLYASENDLAFSAKSFLNMVASRWWPDAQLSDPHRVARLKTVCSDIDDIQQVVNDECVLQRFRRCRIEGLQWEWIMGSRAS